MGTAWFNGHFIKYPTNSCPHGWCGARNWNLHHTRQSAPFRGRNSFSLKAGYSDLKIDKWWAMHGTINPELFQKACKGVIETIFFCLDHATKGAVFSVGPKPGLRAVRVASGARHYGEDQIHWEHPETFDYDSPGSTVLLAEQKELGKLYLLPEQAKRWIDCKIKPKWRRLLSESQAWESQKEAVISLLESLERAVYLVVDKNLARGVRPLPDAIRGEWLRLAYTHHSANNLALLDEIDRLLNNQAAKIHHKQPIKKIFTSFKVLVGVISKVEEQANRIILTARNGSREEATKYLPH